MSFRHSERPDGFPDDREASASDAGNTPEYPSASKASPPILRSWLVANALGFSIASTILVGMTESAGAMGGVTAGVEVTAVAGFVVGAIVGPWQAHILKRKVPHLKSWKWILASIVGSYLGLFFGLITVALFAILLGIRFAPGAIFGAMIGVCVGLVQVLILAHQVRGLRRWWVANVIGRSLGWFVAMFLLARLEDGLGMVPRDHIGYVILSSLFSSAVGGLIYGSVTASALPYLTPRRSSYR